MTSMGKTYFEGREVKPYGDYVLTTDLVAGRVYFKVGYLDEDMVVPELMALVFIGRDVNPKRPGFYFQDAPSYFGGVPFEADGFTPDPDDG